MALIKCPACGKDVSATAVSCPNCGQQIAKKSMGCGAMLGWAALAILAFLIFGYWYGQQNGIGPGYAQRGAGLSEELADSAWTVILDAGYACPSVNRIEALPNEPEGKVVHAWCGPAADPDTVNYDQQYWIAIEARRVQPWADRPHQ